MAARGERKVEKKTRGKRPQDLQIALIREEMHTELVGLIGPLLIFGSQMFMPQRRHLLPLNLYAVLAIVISQLFTVYVFATAKRVAEVKRMHVYNDIFHHVARTSCHILFIAVANDDLMSRLVFLFIAPCDSARMSRHVPFVVYMVVHVLLVLFRFAGDMERELPWIIATLGCSQILYDISVMKQRAEEGALEKARSMIELTEDTAQRVFDCFCDATARVSRKLELLDESPSLSTLLSRRVSTGRSLMDFVHAGDREAYRDFLHQSFGTPIADDDSNVASESSGAGGMQLKSFDLHLEDSMNIPVEVHVFHAQLDGVDEKVIYLVGISERESYKHTQKKAQRHRAARSLNKLNMESGKLEPSRPAFEQKDIALMRDLRSLEAESSGDSSVSAAPTASRTARRRARPRGGSPRPQSRERL